ncbi:hypothetical protein D3C80_1512030 [compost metagenome]
MRWQAPALAGLTWVKVKHLRTFVAGIVQQVLQALQLAGVDDGGVVGVVGNARVQAAHGALVGVAEGRQPFARHQHIVGGDAGLPGVEGLAEGDALGSAVQWHVGRHDGR